MTADCAPLIAFRDVDLAFGDHLVLGKLSLEVRRGEIVCIVGPSGSGKTTALRVAAGLIEPTGGVVAFDGAPMKGPRRDVAVVFQDYAKALLPWRTAAGNVSLALEAAGTPRRGRADRIAELLGKVGLPGQGDKFPTQMSGGMQQRLQIARCLAQEPAALLMDEPFGALDAMTRQGLQDEMLAIAQASGATIFFVTHDLEEAIYLGDRVIGLSPHPGRIGLELEVTLPRPRDQIATRESAEFLRMRRELYDFIRSAEAGKRAVKAWRAFALPAALLILAEIGARIGGPSDSIAPPSAVLLAFVAALADGSLLAATRDTLVSAFAGLAIGAAIGLSLGVLFGAVSAIDRLTELTVEVVRPIPSVAVIPIALVALGFGYRLEIAIVSFAYLWPLLVLSRSAVADVEPRLIEVARVLKLGPFARVFKIIAPAALPRIFVAFRLAAGISLVVAVTVEIAVNPMGLGAGIMTAGQALRPDVMLAYVLWIGLIGFGLNVALTLAQNRLFGQAARIVGEP